MVAVILCGGIGSRLWPISRELLPKQFLTLFAGKSLFQKTLARNVRLADSLLIVTHNDHYFMAYNQLQEELGADSQCAFLLESEQKNTALALALAAMSVQPDDIVLAVPSDHLITNENAYKQAVSEAVQQAQADSIVLFGIKPAYPETGFGYIHAHGQEILSFVEKPSLEIAQQFCAMPNYFWNSGMFCFKARHFLSELRHYAPDVFEAARVAFAHKSTQQAPLQFLIPPASCAAQSIDEALMQKAQNLKVIEANIGWSDMGSFEALSNVLPRDSHGNTQTTAATIDSKACPPILQDSHNNLLITTNRQIALIDVEDLMIIDTADALLIAKKGSGQKVKNIVTELGKRKTSLHSMHVRVYRPWGHYAVLEEGDTYKIKRIEVLPNRRLSLQKHFHRSEHWIVVSGTAVVQQMEQEITLRANESAYIQMGNVHRLSNPCKIPLVLIEVQIGDYLGEDDIVRLDDDYGREGLDKNNENGEKT